MSISAKFGYNNIIPQVGNFSIIVNLKTVNTTSINRVLLFNQHTSGVALADNYIDFRTNGKDLLIVTPNSATSYSGVDTLQYILIDYTDSVLRFWNPNTNTFQILSTNVRLSEPNYSWLYYGPINDGFAQISLPVEIFYIAILDRLLDEYDVKATCNGVHPLENFNIAPDLIFFREYPNHSFNGYPTDIGTGILQSTGVAGTLGFGTKLFSGYSSFVNQDRGLKINISNSITVSAGRSTAINDSIRFGHSLTFHQLAQYPLEHTINITDIVNISDSDLWLNGNYFFLTDTLTFDNFFSNAYDRVITFDNSFKFEQLLKSWDGVIGHTITFQTSIISSSNTELISNSIILANTDISHNVKLNNTLHTLFVTSTLAPSDYNLYTNDDTKGETFEIIERITISLDMSRVLTEQIHMLSEFECYHVKPQDTQNFQ